MVLLVTAEYTVEQFFKDARAATELVLARGHVPIVVGGTGTYLHWCVYALPTSELVLNFSQRRLSPDSCKPLIPAHMNAPTQVL